MKMVAILLTFAVVMAGCSGVIESGETPGGGDSDPCTDPDSATITGTDGADVIDGTDDDDVIFGVGGDDVIRGHSGNDVICGGTGDDRIGGGPGDDHVDGGDGVDSCRGGGPGGGDDDQVVQCEEQHGPGE